jgi:hypothetical protein
MGEVERDVGHRGAFKDGAPVEGFAVRGAGREMGAKVGIQDRLELRVGNAVLLSTEVVVEEAVIVGGVCLPLRDEFGELVGGVGIGAEQTAEEGLQDGSMRIVDSSEAPFNCLIWWRRL